MSLTRLQVKWELAEGVKSPARVWAGEGWWGRGLVVYRWQTWTFWAGEWCQGGGHTGTLGPGAGWQKSMVECIAGWLQKGGTTGWVWRGRFPGQERQKDCARGERPGVRTKAAGRPLQECTPRGSWGSRDKQQTPTKPGSGGRLSRL